MQLKPNYVPKEKTKVNYKIVVPFIIVSALLFYFALAKFLPEEEVDKGYQICNLSGKESSKLIKQREYGPSLLLGDYAQYGESLALYHEPIEFGSKDLFSGKTMFLNNMCHDDERAYMMDVDLDRKLPMQELDDGFYELEVLEGLDRFVLESDQIFEESFYTIARDGYVKKVDLMANKDLFKIEDESIHQKHYVYMNVETIKASSKDYDIVLDPAALTMNDEGYVYYGYSIDGKTESDYTYEIAEALKEKLKEKGLKVKILRNNEDPKNLSGPGGRLEAAYDSGAKYYITLAFPSSGSVNDFGSTVLYSSYASNALATDISQYLSNNTELPTSTWSGDNDVEGVYPSGRKDSFDRTLEIRESGGIATGAGIVTDNPYGKESHHGMQAVYLELGFMTNRDDYQAIHNNEAAIGEVIAKAILKNLGM